MSIDINSSVRRVMRERGMRLADLERITGIPNRRIQIILKTPNPGILTLKKIADGLGMKLSELIWHCENHKN